MDETVTKLSSFGIYLIGPGNRAPGKNRQKEKLSCSKIDTVPSMDCTQRKSLPTENKLKKIQLQLSDVLVAENNQYTFTHC